MSKEALPWILADAWRQKSNRFYAEVEHMQVAPFLFHPWHIKRIVEKFRYSDQWFTFWYKNLTGIEQ
jgi:hypothetical protein